MQGYLCVVKKIAGFNYQCKTRALLCRKALPLVKGWDVGDFTFYLKPSLQKNLLGSCLNQ